MRRVVCWLLLVLAAVAALTPAAGAERETRFHHGVLECSAGVGEWPSGVSTADVCGRYVGDGSYFTVRPSSTDPVSGAVYEVDWDAGRAPLADTLALLFPPSSNDNVLAHTSGTFLARGTAAGPNRLMVRLESLDPGLPVYWPQDFAGEGPRFEVRVRDGAAVLLPFRMAVTWFRGEPVPAGFSAFDEGHPAAAAAPPADAPSPAVLVPTESAPSLLSPAAAVAALFALAAARLASVRRFAFAGLAFFTRLQRERVLDHPRRHALESLVRAEPGIGYEQARRRLEWGPGAFNYHLHVLCRHRLVTAQRVYGHVRLYTPGAPAVPPPTPSVPELLVALVRAEPGLSQREAARRLGVPERTLGYHAAWLCRDGRLERRRDGRCVRFQAPRN